MNLLNQPIYSLFWGYAQCAATSTYYDSQPRHIVAHCVLICRSHPPGDTGTLIPPASFTAVKRKEFDRRNGLFVSIAQSIDDAQCEIESIFVRRIKDTKVGEGIEADQREMTK